MSDIVIVVEAEWFVVEDLMIWLDCDGGGWMREEEEEEEKEAEKRDYIAVGLPCLSV